MINMAKSIKVGVEGGTPQIGGRMSQHICAADLFLYMNSRRDYSQLSRRLTISYSSVEVSSSLSSGVRRWLALRFSPRHLQYQIHH